ncbi:GNAT family N-acetyltransferase [Thermoflavimicrobium dichotomicum]|uniref:Acetyltransferase (GNAT) family protein n=1 Tax=Thermoflavimicrobium dichotomicum TaxID=46223 RepID=A0A1I3QEB0_9BACL|nr:GNAT family N-acetyltransferase [Thermoflavimicrobium dichotomicum]SFJ32564.1 Acetyltransferase (GNAT) family protein [Thermoflavimicrobium dichotomicum]
MEPEPKIEMIRMNKDLIPEASNLLAGYLHAYDRQQMECAQILERLLDDQIAQCWLARFEKGYGGLMILAWSFSVSMGLPVLRVEALYTLPAYRKKGLAEKLLQHAIHIAKEHGAARLQLETDDNNVPARTLYAKYGFKCLPNKKVYMLLLSKK